MIPSAIRGCNRRSPRSARYAVAHQTRGKRAIETVAEWQDRALFDPAAGTEIPRSDSPTTCSFSSGSMLHVL